VRTFVQRSALIAMLVLVLDESVKTWARLRLAPCNGPMTNCDRIELIGPLWLVHTANAGSAFGFRQGWWIWVVLAACGFLLIFVYGVWLRGAGWPAALGVGLQVGGALGNLLDRVVIGGASDVLYVGGGLTWNLADVALVGGTLIATWALARTLLPAVWKADLPHVAEAERRTRAERRLR
jgi:signal peptidase II